MEYEKFLGLARKYKGDQANSECKFLELLVEQEADVLNWKHPRTPYKSWNELLQEEGLCTVTTYRNYKRARSLISEVWINKLGVYASISISKLEANSRTRVLKEVKQWYSRHRVTPTYQRVSKYVRDMGALKTKAKSRSKVQKLKAYIRECQALLKKNKIPVPLPSPV